MWWRIREKLLQDGSLVERFARLRSRLYILGLLSFLAGPRMAWSWGCEGHETIALIAEKHLTPPARRMVRALLDPSPIDPRLPRFCHPSEHDLLADVSTWADDVRRDERSPFFGTGQWHFIDIPRAASGGDIGRFCPARAGCIITALEQELAVLRQGGANRQRQAEALMLVIHLIGDLHQPLHCATNNDAGGNCVPLRYFGITPQLSADRPENEVYQPNLHAIWDTTIIRRITARRSAGWFADFLERHFEDRVAAWQRAQIDMRAWAWETHGIAERTAYGQLPVPIPLAAPQRAVRCLDVSERLLALHERVGQHYQDAATPVIEEQLAKAGLRLALVLNQIWR